MDEAERQAIRERARESVETRYGDLLYIVAREDVPKLLEALGVVEMKKNVWVSKYTDACRENERLQKERDEWKEKAGRLEKENERFINAFGEVARMTNWFQCADDEILEGINELSKEVLEGSE